MEEKITCKECGCFMRNKKYYPCHLHWLGLPREIRKFMKENSMTWGS